LNVFNLPAPRQHEASAHRHTIAERLELRNTYSVMSKSGNNLTQSYKLTLFTALLTAVLCSPVAAQTGERWFSVEVSVFSNESAVDRIEETWSAHKLALDYPSRLTDLIRFVDLFMLQEFLPDHPSPANTAPGNAITDDDADPEAAELRAQIAATGPHPANPPGEFRLPDLDRDAFVQLPPALSDFQQTNRTINQAGEYRLLFHGLWRQPMASIDNATAVFVSGGAEYGDHSELEGSLKLGFNNERDRVVIEADLWLTQFSTFEPEQSNWEIPSRPAIAPETNAPRSELNAPEYYPTVIYHMEQSREMRSDEFHFLDHPAMGLVIQVQPYEVPPLPQPDLFPPEEDQLTQ